MLIDGGERLATVPVEWVAAANDLPPGTDPALVDGIDDLPRTLVVRTTVFGDFSRYTLHLRANSGSDQPPAGSIRGCRTSTFSFKVECPSDFDCADATTVSAGTRRHSPTSTTSRRTTPGFRRLMLDRLNLLAPGWSERSAADVGVALVELLAYAADNLSYRQDAIANEAYLATAHKRVSVRRHARLVDYALHDGCNARAWVHVEVVGRPHALPQGTHAADADRQSARCGSCRTARTLRDALAAGAIGVRDGARPTDLFTDLNTLSFYTWGDLGCCLPRGATRATLARRASRSCKPNDVLVFQEVGEPDDVQGEGRRSREALGGPADRGEGGRRSVRPAVRRPAGGCARCRSPRSPGTPPTRCPSRCACR